MGATDLSAALWRERELLELLVFKLEEEQLLLAAGRTRWVGHASREVDDVLERLSLAGLERGVESAAVAAEWGLPAEAPLRQVVAASPEGPWAEILSAHLAAMIELTTRIRSLRDENERYLRAVARATQETLAGPIGTPTLYDDRGAVPAGAGARLFDTAL